MLWKAFIAHIKGLYGGIPSFVDLLDPKFIDDPKRWRFKTKTRVNLRYVQDEVAYETIGLYAGGWEELVDHIVSMELIILEA